MKGLFLTMQACHKPQSGAHNAMTQTTEHLSCATSCRDGTVPRALRGQAWLWSTTTMHTLETSTCSDIIQARHLFVAACRSAGITPGCNDHFTATCSTLYRRTFVDLSIAIYPRVAIYTSMGPTTTSLRFHSTRSLRVWMLIIADLDSNNPSPTLSINKLATTLGLLYK